MKNKFKNKNVLIVGLKKSGESSLELLQKLGAFCYVYDDNKDVLKCYGGRDNCNIASFLDEDLIKVMDYMIISPGVSIYCECVKLANLYGVKVLSELELGTSFARGKIIGITGTNGKTTTCSLIYHILKIAKHPAVLCGNIGEPITANILPFKTNYVVEMSSFQLESAEKLRPNIAAITNITPNHLDRHLTFNNYRDSKFNIFKNMQHCDTLILNYDDKTLRTLKNQKVHPKIIWISIKDEIDGYFVEGHKVFYKHKNKTECVIDIENIKLVGKHNLYNILIALAVGKKLKVSDKVIEFAVSSFEPLTHRLQFVKNVNGVDYVNDSKSTSPDSTITAIDAFHKKPLILLLGGSDKNASFDKLAKKIKHSSNIKLVVVSGATSQKIISSLKKYGVKNYHKVSSFLEGLTVATKLAESGDTILLSPACASFDYFRSFEERGEKFCEYVEKLKNT